MRDLLLYFRKPAFPVVHPERTGGVNSLLPAPMHGWTLVSFIAAVAIKEIRIFPTLSLLSSRKPLFTSKTSLNLLLKLNHQLL